MVGFEPTTPALRNPFALHARFHCHSNALGNAPLVSAHPPMSILLGGVKGADVATSASPSGVSHDVTERQPRPELQDARHGGEMLCPIIGDWVTGALRVGKKIGTVSVTA